MHQNFLHFVMVILFMAYFIAYWKIRQNDIVTNNIRSNFYFVLSFMLFCIDFIGFTLHITIIYTYFFPLLRNM